MGATRKRTDQGDQHEDFMPRPAHHMFGTPRHMYSGYKCLVHQGFDLPVHMDPMPTMEDLNQCVPADAFRWLFIEPEPFECEGIWEIEFYGLRYFISVKDDKCYDTLDGIILTLNQARVKFEDATFLACLFFNKKQTC